MTAATEALRQCIEAMKLVDFKDCGESPELWQKLNAAQANAERVLREGEKQKPVGYDIFYDGEPCRHNFPTLKRVQQQKTYMDRVYPGHERVIMPLYTLPAPSLQAVVEVQEETESPTFMGEPVILSKVNDGNRKRAECFLEIMVALNIVPGSDQWNKAAEATRAYIASPSPVGVGEEGETTSDYSAMRLRLIAEKLGLGKAIPKKNADLWACAFPVLGMIRREVEKLAAPQPPAAPQWQTMCHALLDIWDDSFNHPDERTYMESAWPDQIKELRKLVEADKGFVPPAAPAGNTMPVSVRALADNLLIAVDNLGHAEGGLEGLDQLHAAARHLRRGLGE